MQPRILYECPGCGQTLNAPPQWAGNNVICPRCGIRHQVPPVSALAREDVMQRGSHDQGPSSLALEPLSFGPSPPATGRGRSARTRTLLLVVLAAAALASVIGGWQFVYHKYVSPRARMHSRAARVPQKAFDASILVRVRRAERNSDFGTRDLASTQELFAAYEACVEAAGRLPRNAHAYCMNNYAWVLLTTPHRSLRDPGKALKLASKAVAESGRKEPAYLDTLAEAYFQEGKPGKAVRTEEEAIELNPDDVHLKRQLRKFRCAQSPGASFYGTAEGRESGDRDAHKAR